MLVLCIRRRQKDIHESVQVLTLLLSQFVGHTLIEDTDIGRAIVGEARLQIRGRQEGVEELAAP